MQYDRGLSKENAEEQAAICYGFNCKTSLEIFVDQWSDLGSMAKNRIEQRIINSLEKMKEQEKSEQVESEMHPSDFSALDVEQRQAIINPKHYQMIPAGTYPNGIQYMGLVALLMLKKDKLDRYEAHIYSQVLKYLLRLGEKDTVRQDLKKVIWYAELFQLYQDVKDGNATTQEFVEQWSIMEVMEQK